MQRNRRDEKTREDGKNEEIKKLTGTNHKVNQGGCIKSKQRQLLVECSDINKQLKECTSELCTDDRNKAPSQTMRLALKS